MANLVSPGVQVSVTDESVYGPAGAGTVPMIFIATGENKVDPTGTESDGVAKYTKPAFAGKPVLVTSQRELTQYFGNIDFRSVSGSVAQGDETNDYGLLAAYSFLGQSSAAYIVRADVDLTALRPMDNEPAGNPANGTYWVNPASSNFGIFEYTASGWTVVEPTVEIVSAAGTATATPVEGEYLVEVVATGTSTSVVYYKGDSNPAWVQVTATFDPHFSAPASPSLGDTWVKTTQPGGGLDLDVRQFSAEAGGFVALPIAAVNDDGTYVPQDGTSASAVTLVEGDVSFDISGGTVSLEVQNSGTQAMGAEVSSTAPTGAPADGTLWFDTDVNELHIYEVNSSNEWEKATSVTYATGAPAVGPVGAYWVDTNASDYPAIYRSNGSTWVLKDNTDQSTSEGVVFGDITAADDATVDSASVLAGGPDPLVYPAGITGVNMCRSGNTVRVYDASATTAWKWRNHAGNQANGAGSFGRVAQRKVVVTAMQASASGTELREETVAFRLIAAPGYAEMYDEMVTLNTDRNETAFVIVDAPFRKNPTEAVSWIQGSDAVENGEDGLVGRNTYSAAYYPSVLTTDPVSGASVVAPASHSVLYTYAYSDNVSFQWFAPAGLTRGVVQNASNVGYINDEGEFTPVALNQGARDVMYDNKLNPIARFPAEGIVVYGQKTLHSGASALDRVNVARLTAYLRERFAVIGRPYIFEPNDANTRKNAKQTFDGFMGNILAQRGVYDFAVVCDETNNTPARIDANELYIDVGIEPTKAAEFIYIPIRLVNTGEL